MPHARKPMLVSAFRAESPEAWPDTVWDDPDKALVMKFIGELVASGAAEWGWLLDGAIELRLRFGPVFHLRDSEIKRVR